MKHLARRIVARLRRGPVPAEDLWVSIVINTLNRAASLQRTLDGLEQLDDDNFEVIVVAGPSSDDTDAVLRRYDKRVRVGRCPVPMLGQSRNVGVAMAAGDIVAFIDDDAIPRQDWLKQLRRGYADPAVAGVGGFTYDAVNGCIQWRLCTATHTGAVAIDAAPPCDNYQGPDANPFLFLCGCNMSYRRADLFAAGGFNVNLRSIYDDVEIATRMHRRGRLLFASEAPMVDHYVDSSHVRDGNRIVRDPCNLMHDYAVFVMQTMPETARNEAVAAAHAQAKSWHATAAQYRADGLLTQDEHDRFAARTDEGLRDGLVSGAAERTTGTFRPVRKWDFVRFK